MWEKVIFMCHLLGVDREKLHTMQENARIGQIKSLSEVVGGEEQSMTRKDTGEALGIAAGAVQNLESKAMRTLRMPHKCRKFKPYFEQYLSAQFSSCGEFPKNMDK